MTTTHPPLLAEAILESFGAAPEFSDAIIGDLAQEHAQRVERYGEQSARMWYVREALLAVPHLLRNWLAGARLADVRRLINVAGLAYVSSLMVGAAVSFVAYSVASVFGYDLSWRAATPIPLPALYAASIIAPGIAGYFAASFEESRPMLASAVLAIAWSLAIIGGALLAVAFLPELLQHPVIPSTLARLSLVPFVMSAAMVGGGIRIRLKLVSA